MFLALEAERIASAVMARWLQASSTSPSFWGPSRQRCRPVGADIGAAARASWKAYGDRGIPFGGNDAANALNQTEDSQRA
ncbi:MAG: hypothetical protein M0Z43_13185 [Acidithiobacillus sp.]|nr:hypothetical protein [Acidithiobacillus sp.]